MAVNSRLVVLGSANRDLVVRTERIPAPGETVLGSAFVTAAGGKGANQAVAAARLGGQVQFIGRLGADAFGDALFREMSDAGIDLTYLKRDANQPTGVALIGVDMAGQNAIIVAPGANSRVSPEDVETARESIAAANMLVIQLEIPRETVEYAVRLATEVGTSVLLNPAPIRHTHPLSDDLLGTVDILTPNEHEAAALLGYAEPEGLDWEEAAQELRNRGVKTVVITLGEAGCVAASDAGVQRYPAIPVVPVDTTAAGDCFTGALAVALSEDRPLGDAITFAARAAALSVTRIGAQPSLPTRAEVETFSAGL